MLHLRSALALSVSLLLAGAVIPVPRLTADEGMWLFNDLPQARLAERYDFQPTDAWAEHLRLASVRFNSGGSGSFVSSDGLVLTNHHVASDTLYKLSTPERNIIETGFLAKAPADELKAPDLELNRLVSIEDVTERVDAAVEAEMSAEEAAKARRAAMTRIETASLEATGLRSDVITLYGGAVYHLYRYKKYTDVRLVWAPETKAAFFGGDADNFEYPRYCLDATLMRVYEDGKPAKLEHFLQWSDEPVASGDLVFVSGNPGRTQRIFTVDALQYLRDQRLPYVLDYIRRKEVMLQQYGLGGAEQTRRARDELFGIQNARKAYTGMLAGLQDPATIAKKQEQEQRRLAALRDVPALEPLAQAWQTVAALQQDKAEQLGTVTGFRSRLYELAETLVLMTAEDEKPNAERLREYTEAGRESLLQDLYSEAPIYDDLERVKLADELGRLAESRGGDDPLVQQVLDGQSPSERASSLVGETQLQQIVFRKQLAAGGSAAIEASEDPLIVLARQMEEAYRHARAAREELDEQEKQAYAKITRAINALEGTDTYPDATFTLRLAFGTVRGYEERGETIPPSTDFAGAFAHAEAHAGQEDFDLPASWLEAKQEARLELATQLNFVSTVDIIGGNSGSPVVDRQGRLVGLIFDGNLHSLTSDYLYTDQQARAISVAAVGIREALRSIYGAGSLAESLGK